MLKKLPHYFLSFLSNKTCCSSKVCFGSVLENPLQLFLVSNHIPQLDTWYLDPPLLVTPTSRSISKELSPIDKTFSAFLLCDCTLNLQAYSDIPVRGTHSSYVV
uniref:Uncharacterized protein n=1 Tax=Opuntia streptacantha TaxID=393608 RepID=A0A7C8ZBA7_OPUST